MSEKSKMFRFYQDDDLELDEDYLKNVLPSNNTMNFQFTKNIFENSKEQEERLQFKKSSDDDLQNRKRLELLAKLNGPKKTELVERQKCKPYDDDNLRNRNRREFFEMFSAGRKDCQNKPSVLCSSNQETSKRIIPGPAGLLPDDPVPNQKAIDSFKGPINTCKAILPGALECGSFLCSSNQVTSKRKLPGPAGLLPDEPVPNQKAVDYFKQPINTCKAVVPVLPDEKFTSPAWLKMEADLSNGENEEIKIPDSFTIAWLRKKLIFKELIDLKAPFLCVIIESIDYTNRDPITVLRDKTGVMNAAIIGIYDDYSSVLIPGAVLVLKDVGVLTLGRKHYLAITLSNLITIYSNNQNESNYVRVTNVKDVKHEDYALLAKDIQNKYINRHKYNMEREVSKENEIPSKRSRMTFDKLSFHKQSSFNSVTKVSTQQTSHQIKETHQVLSIIQNRKEIRQSVTSTNEGAICASSKSVVSQVSCSQVVQCNIKKGNDEKINSINLKCVRKEFVYKRDDDSLRHSTETVSATKTTTATLLTLDNLQEREVLNSILDGVDTSSLFDDF